MIEKEHFHILLPEGYKEFLKVAAARQAISLSDLIKQVIDESFFRKGDFNGRKTLKQDN